MPLEKNAANAGSGAEHADGGEGVKGRAGDMVMRLFLAACIVIAIVPLVLIPVGSAAVGSEKKDLAELPSILVDGHVNLQYLSELGLWFDDHFAFRGALVDADASLRATLFGTSSVRNVVVGTDGWLYYAGTLNDYQRTLVMTERELDNAAFNLAMIQEYALSRGVGFAFVIAPDKCSLYPGHMPYYELAGEGPSNAERLELYLEAYGVNYVNLFDAFSEHEGVLYYERDSHWNPEGALLAYNMLLDSLGKVHETYESLPSETRCVHLGDVEGMLTPESVTPEPEIFWPDSERFSYVNDTSSPEDSYVVTSSLVAGAEGRLLCFRDSFGNALLPYLACAYEDATFSRLVPYELGFGALDGIDDLIIERTERHLPFYASNPPYLPAPEREGVIRRATEEGAATARAVRVGDYVRVEGDIDPALVGDDSRFYVRVRTDSEVTHTYEAFHVSADRGLSTDADTAGSAATSVTSDYGYVVTIDDPEICGSSRVGIEVLVGGPDSATGVLTTQIDMGGI